MQVAFVTFNWREIRYFSEDLAMLLCTAFGSFKFVVYFCLNVFSPMLREQFIQFLLLPSHLYVFTKRD